MLPRGDFALIIASETQPSSLEPARAQRHATPEGRRVTEGWLREPVGHARDIRSELLVKLALLDRAGADPRELLRPSTSGSPQSRTGWPAR